MKKIKLFLFILSTMLICISFAKSDIPSDIAKQETEKGIYSQFIQNIISENIVQNPQQDLSYQDFLNRFPNNISLKIDYFLFKIRTANLDEAYKYGLDLYSTSNINDEFLAIMGYLCIALGKYDEALKYLTEIKNTKTTKKNIDFLMGIAYYEKRDFKNAIKMFEKSHEKEPFEIEFISYISNSFNVAESKKITIEYFKNLELYEKYNYIIFWYTANLYENFSLDEAEKYYLKVLELNPPKITTSLTYTRLGNIAYLKKETDKALYYLTEAEKNIDKKRFDKFYEEILEQTADLYRIKKDYKNAGKYKEKFIEFVYENTNLDDQKIKTEYIDDMLELSYFYDKFEQKKSLEILEKLKKQFPDNLKINLYLSINYFTINEFPQSIIYINIAEGLEKDLSRKRIYRFILQEILSIENNYIENIMNLKFQTQKEANAMGLIPFERTKKYLETLQLAYIKCNAKLNIKTKKINYKIKMDLDYNTEYGAVLNLFINNTIPPSNIVLSPDKINDLKTNKNMDIIKNTDIYIAKFLSFLNLSASDLIYETQDTKYLFYKLANTDVQITTDLIGNILSIEDPETKLMFTKFNKFERMNLPYKFIIKQTQESIWLDYDVFDYSFKQKFDLEKRLLELNENKCKCKN